MEEPKRFDIKSMITNHFIGHAIFLVVNIGIVISNLVIPRFIDEEDLQIVSVEPIADEREAVTLPYTSNEVTYALQNDPKDRGFWAASKCAELFFQGYVPFSCRDQLVEKLSSAASRLREDESKRIEIVKSLKAWDAEDFQKLMERTGGFPFYDESISYSVAQLVSAQNFNRADQAESVEALKENLILHFRAKYELYRTLEAASLEISTLGDQPQRSGKVGFEITLMNYGHSDALVLGGAVLEVADLRINMMRVDSSDLRDADFADENIWYVHSPSKAYSLKYTPNPNDNSARDLDQLSKLVADGLLSTYKISIPLENRTVSFSGSSTFKVVTFETLE